MGLAATLGANDLRHITCRLTAEKVDSEKVVKSVKSSHPSTILDKRGSSSRTYRWTTRSATERPCTKTPTADAVHANEQPSRREKKEL
jgi:hypothetical protein